MSSGEPDCERLLEHRLAWIERHRAELIERREELIGEVRACWADACLGSGVSIAEAHAIDDNEDCRHARTRDAHIAWRDVKPADVDPSGSALSFMDAEGFHFYLPAYLIDTLRRLPCDANRGSGRLMCHDTILWRLESIGEQMIGWRRQGTDPSSKVDRCWVANMYALLKNEQIRCIARCLVFERLVDDLDDFANDPARAWWIEHLDPDEKARAAAEQTASRSPQ